MQPEPDAPWLEALAGGDAAEFRALGTERRYQRGVVLFHHGDEPGAVAAILAGRVKLVVPAPQGKDVMLGLAGPGDVLGDVAALDGRPRSATAQAMDPVKATLVPRAAFVRFVAERPTVALAVMHSLARRLRGADAQLMEFAAYDVIGRVARRLVELCEQHGEAHERGVLTGVALSQDELAAWTASSREAVAKALQILRGLGWIETHRRHIVVLDLESLRDYTRQLTAVRPPQSRSVYRCTKPAWRITWSRHGRGATLPPCRPASALARPAAPRARITAVPARADAAAGGPSRASARCTPCPTVTRPPWRQRFGG